jgi:hypothetical protein
MIHPFHQPPLPAGGRWAPPPLTELAAEDPEMVTANREASIAKAEAEIARIEAALDSPVYRLLVMDPSDENPDLTAEGVPSYGGYLCELRTTDGSAAIAGVYCNSQRLTQGAIDGETGEYDADAIVPASTDLAARATLGKMQLLADIRLHRADIAAVADGTYDPDAPI